MRKHYKELVSERYIKADELAGKTISACHELWEEEIKVTGREDLVGGPYAVLVFEDDTWTLLSARQGGYLSPKIFVEAPESHLDVHLDWLVEIGVLDREKVEDARKKDDELKRREWEAYQRRQYEELREKFERT